MANGIDFSGDVQLGEETIQIRRENIQFVDNARQRMTTTLNITRQGFAAVTVTLSFRVDDYLRLPGSEEARIQAVRQKLVETRTTD